MLLFTKKEVLYQISKRYSQTVIFLPPYSLKQIGFHADRSGFAAGRNALESIGQRGGLPCKRLRFVQPALIMRQVEQAGEHRPARGLAVQAVVFRAVRFDYAAGGSSWMRSGRLELCRATACVSYSPLRLYGGLNALNVQRTARALPYNWLSFVQSALIMRRAERAECAADGEALPCNRLCFVPSASDLRQG